MDKWKWRDIKRAQGIERKAYILLGDDWGGNPNPPGMNTEGRTVGGSEGTEKVYTFHPNDGFELWVGYPDEWITHFDPKEWKMIWWVITKRYLSTWFGIRRWIWYRLLFRSVERHRQMIVESGHELEDGPNTRTGVAYGQIRKRDWSRITGHRKDSR